MAKLISAARKPSHDSHKSLQQQMITLDSTNVPSKTEICSYRGHRVTNTLCFFALCCSHLIGCSTMPMPSLKMKLVGVLLVHIHMYPNLHTQCHFNHICDFMYS